MKKRGARLRKGKKILEEFEYRALQVGKRGSQRRAGTLNFKKLWVAFLLLVWSCTPASLEDLRCQAEAEMSRLLIDLRAIETKEDIQKASKRLKKRFNQIAELLIEAKKFSPKEVEFSQVGEELFIEFARIYEIPGGREAIEIAQLEAVHILNRAS